MRFVVMLAAVAALWVQPAGAVITESGKDVPADQIAILSYFQGMIPASDLHPKTFAQFVMTTDVEGLGGITGTCRQVGIGDCPSWGGIVQPSGPHLFLLGTEQFEIEKTFTLTRTRIIDTLSVPEPETWALMILGLGATGVMLRRRKHQATAARA